MSKIQQHARKHRIFLVEQNAFALASLRADLGNDPYLEVVGAVASLEAANELIVRALPDVVLLSAAFSKEESLQFVRNLAKGRPVTVPLVLCTSHSTSDMGMSQRMLELGAVSVVHTRSSPLEANSRSSRTDLCTIVRTAAGSPSSLRTAPARTALSSAGTIKTTPIEVLAIGASTGGIEAIATVLNGLPADCAPTVIVQHMPQKFTGQFAERLNKYAPMAVREARDGDVLEQGLALLAPGGEHLEIVQDEAQIRGWKVSLGRSAPAEPHCPSVNIMFHSVARSVGGGSCGVILTGMGQDGAKGLLAMRKTGARTYGQSLETCVVYGMPKVAMRVGAVQSELPLDEIAQAITLPPKTL
jgi:two-component system chemotaxis response regulator CheB